MNTIINTRADLDAAKESAPEGYRQFIELLKGATHTLVDTQVYPEGYDRSLAVEQAGYLAPHYEPQVNADVAARFGFTVAEIDAL